MGSPETHAYANYCKTNSYFNVSLSVIAIYSVITGFENIPCTNIYTKFGDMEPPHSSNIFVRLNIFHIRYKIKHQFKLT